MDWRELRFLFDGERIQHDETPESATLEDGDQLQALLVQDGGFAFPLHRVGVDEDGMDGGGSGEKTMKKFGWNESQLIVRTLAMVASSARPAITNVMRSPIVSPVSIAASSSIETSGGPS